MPSVDEVKDRVPESVRQMIEQPIERLSYGKGAQVEQGLSALAEALTMAGKSRERYYDAELRRLR